MALVALAAGRDRCRDRPGRARRLPAPLLAPTSEKAADAPLSRWLGWSPPTSRGRTPRDRRPDQAGRRVLGGDAPFPTDVPPHARGLRRRGQLGAREP